MTPRTTFIVIQFVVSTVLITLGFTVLSGGVFGDLLRSLGSATLVAPLVRSINIAAGNEDKWAATRSGAFPWWAVVVMLAIAAGLLAVGYTVLYGDEWWYVRAAGFGLVVGAMIALPMPQRAARE